VIAALDVAYDGERAVAAAVVFDRWDADWPAAEYLVRVPTAAAYQPGAFAERELPALRAVLAEVAEPLRLLVVDGYVWLDAEGRPGLGAHLHRETHLPVIGVAKTTFQGSPHAVAVTRGHSRRPLYVTAVGLPPEEAAGLIHGMHGASRYPTLLLWADQLARRVPAHREGSTPAR
jgi:deoxyribonuclease V